MKKLSFKNFPKLGKFSGLGGVKKFIKAASFQSKIPKEKEQSLIVEKLPGYFLIVATLVALYYLFDVLRPFISILALAAVLAIAFYPFFKWVLKYVKYKGVASALSCLFVILVIIVPLILFTLLLANEAANTYTSVRQQVDSGAFDKYLEWKQGGVFYDLKNNIETFINPFVDVSTLDIKKSIVDTAQSLSSYLFKQASGILATIFSSLFSFVLLLFAMYYFFKDGDELVKRLGSLSPLPGLYENELFRKMDSMVKAIFIGVFLTAVIQGTVGGIGYAIAGVSNPIFWGTATGFFSFVPVVGTAAIWLPTAIILAAMGNYGAAIFVFIWGFFVVGTVDNFARPYLIGGRAKTYPLATFFVILGGIFTMGLKGIIFGPLILMVVMSLLHIYEIEYKKVLKK